MLSDGVRARLLEGSGPVRSSPGICGCSPGLNPPTGAGQCVAGRSQTMAERPVAMAQGDAVELLVRQHQEIRRLLGEVEGNAGEVRAEVFARLRRFLAMHETVNLQMLAH